jgi:pyruvate formate lyase activating enzyme
VGNIANRDRQTTRCPSCRKPLIERSSYEVLRYEIAAGCCKHCGTPIAGRFDERPGDWGSRRQGVRISEFERKVGQEPQALVQLGGSYQIRQRPAAPDA